MASNKKPRKKHNPFKPVSPLFAIRRSILRGKEAQAEDIASMMIPLYQIIEHLKAGTCTEGLMQDLLNLVVFFDGIACNGYAEADAYGREIIKSLRPSLAAAVEAIDGIAQRENRTGKIGVNTEELKQLYAFAEAAHTLIIGNNMHVLELSRMQHELRLDALNAMVAENKKAREAEDAKAKCCAA